MGKDSQISGLKQSIGSVEDKITNLQTLIHKLEEHESNLHGSNTDGLINHGEGWKDTTTLIIGNKIDELNQTWKSYEVYKVDQAINNGYQKITEYENRIESMWVEIGQLNKEGSE